MRKIAVFSSLLILFFCVFMLASQRRESPPPVGVEPPAPEVVRTVYDEGRKTGYQALFRQMAYMDQDPSLVVFEGDEPEKEVRYTSDEHNKEEFMRGYVDGYHRAADIYSKKKVLNAPQCPY